MANLKASKKDIRKSAKRRELNRYQRARLRTFDKKVRKLAEEGQQDEARKAFQEFTIYLDRAGRRNLIHPKQADRRKSRIALLLNRMATQAPAPAPEPTPEENTEEAGAA